MPRTQMHVAPVCELSSQTSEIPLQITTMDVSPSTAGFGVGKELHNETVWLWGCG